jgi:hypothetical protein
MNFFQIDDDVELPGRWHLSHPKNHLGEWVDPASFEEGQIVAAPGLLRIAIFQRGTPLDLTLAEQFLPIANARTVELLTRLVPKELQTIPISVEGQTEPYWILNATVALDCIDPQASRGLEYWTPEDGRPERVGDLSSVLELRLDPAKIGGHRFFRVKRWLHALIVSEDVKRALEAAKIVGPRFISV